MRYHRLTTLAIFASTIMLASGLPPVWERYALAQAADAMPAASERTVFDPGPAEQGNLAAERFDEAMNAAEPPREPVRPANEQGEIDLLEMASPRVGGVFMYPIYFFSFVVVLFGIERWIGLRRRKVLPRRLVREVNAMLDGQVGFDPRKVWRLCQRYPSSSSNVIKAALLRTGKPLADLEETVNKGLEREAARLYANVRPLNLSATVAPLLGLVGTVQGMIIAFYETAYLPDGADKAQALAGGVYIALVTTFAGLCVAIPAVCLAHYFEGKIQRMLGRLEDLLAGLLPVLERYEGKLRIMRGPTVAHAGNDPLAEADPPHRSAATSE